MSEFLRTTRTVGLALALGIGAAACGEGTGTQSTGHDQNSAGQESGPQKSDISMSPVYFEDGSRLLQYHGFIKEMDNGGSPKNILEYCDGNSLVAETMSSYGTGGAPSIIAEYPPCADGKLTPEDFKLSPH